MSDKITHKDRFHQTGHLAGRGTAQSAKEADSEELSCGAFGYLRGIKDRASTVEFQFRTGNTMWFPYSLLGQCRYDPSEGVLLKFSGDLLYVVLIKGSNLDLPLNDGNMNLTSGGLQRQRVVWVREMSPEEIKLVGERGPTIDRITIEGFESQSEVKDWLIQNAPAFLR
jgi:hypothetical protein